MHDDPSNGAASISIFGTEKILTGHAQRISLPKGAAIRQHPETPRFAHVLLSGLIATSLRFKEGRSVFTRVQSAGDLIEIDHVLGCYQADTVSRVLIPGVAVRIPFATLQSTIEEDAGLRKGLLRSLGQRVLEAECLSACNLVHPLEQRLARYLLDIAQRMNVISIPLTQGQLAQLLGVRRTSIVFTAGELRRKKLIDFRRASILIQDSLQLEQAACDCYRKIANYRVVDAGASASGDLALAEQQVA
ncbi:Crp/Fnr family transcriptional regulator [Silvibacterium acidisoli]|uniref:Crp/Fnr family transcriptional regulator n=1 Tax=Acidobacteriaceae bacterium ZG23-2 TaxID=2883246 RepID=UPI00406D3521